MGRPSQDERGAAKTARCRAATGEARLENGTPGRAGTRRRNAWEWLDLGGLGLTCADLNATPSTPPPSWSSDTVPPLFFHRPLRAPPPPSSTAASCVQLASVCGTAPPARGVYDLPCSPRPLAAGDGPSQLARFAAMPRKRLQSLIWPRYFLFSWVYVPSKSLSNRKNGE